ncbi:hypothetical protein TTHERM_00599870 (macronuclear) [Tetrahymena thermophila SB210]|uniref:Uncharacterized protein n=1 Tax=Tetrahymena thermophila (strain SB210) TaxID=312017 RepID=I7M695_TETTS|nr:hypothetical protein TTHERM_00599870 [Tetrahymena thermophila SB210]EAR84798.2 hypothetical protein TTHERM_00599870 [Tetrahymena thermophila SB210]|eukprot:XP_001032461.2 hypothetical protein TTHERM_00599870 [Tetrahymena thermophila SB210]
MKYKKIKEKVQKSSESSPIIDKNIAKRKGDQGRPKKPSKELREEENKIKQISMNLSYLEEALIQNYGGFEFQNKIETKNKALNLIEKHFGLFYKQKFDEMLTERDQLLKMRIDPIEYNVVPLSSEYFLIKYTNNANKTIDLKLFLTIFLFFIFFKTDDNGYEEIFSYLKEIYKSINIDCKHIIENMNSNYIFQVIKPQQRIEIFKDFYKYMYQEMDRLLSQYQIKLVIQ